jgi:hypothetical protein
MGGAYHGALVEAALAGCAGLLVFFLALAWSSAGRAADGSILAQRMAAVLPRFPGLLLATGMWFALGERLEPAHGGTPVLFAVLALVLAAWLLHHLAVAAIGLLAEAVLAIVTSPFAARTPSWSRRAAPVPIARRSPLLRRRFARPPPIASTGARL